MLRVENLSKRYGDFVAVKNVTFSANKGDVVGFLGPNGAGKTSTIRMLVTFLPPTKGTAIVAGHDIVSESDEVRKKIGYLPETPPLYPEMTVEEYLSFVARLKGVPSKEIKPSVDKAISQCFLNDVSKKLCGFLSKGYRQRVGIAQAIVHDPEVIILDEPTSGLDPKQIIEIRQLIKSLGAGKTVILSTHILPEVSQVCNKVVIINRGEVVLEQGLKELEAQKPLEQVFLERLNVGRDVAAEGI